MGWRWKNRKGRTLHGEDLRENGLGVLECHDRLGEEALEKSTVGGVVGALVHFDIIPALRHGSCIGRWTPCLEAGWPGGVQEI